MAHSCIGRLARFLPLIVNPLLSPDARRLVILARRLVLLETRSKPRRGASCCRFSLGLSFEGSGFQRDGGRGCWCVCHTHHCGCGFLRERQSRRFQKAFRFGLTGMSATPSHSAEDWRQGQQEQADAARSIAGRRTLKQVPVILERSRPALQPARKLALIPSQGWSRRLDVPGPGRGCPSD